MTEDELYRTSTQYRLWNFTPEKLASIRASTNTLATEHVKAAFKRKRAAKSQPTSTDVSAAASDVEGNGVHNGAAGKKDAAKGEKEVQCLTAEEEKKIIDFYCSNLLQMATKPPFEFPINVVGTAVQYLKRFYISHSPMDYHPRQIMPAALFLATKTENFHTPLKTFAEKLKQVPGLTKLTAENVLAPEFILTQGLRFCFDIRHPYRALKGFYLECTILMQIAKGEGPPAEWTNRDSVEIQHSLLQKGTPAKFLKSIDESYGRAKDILNSAALLSDAYFLYTPSQILFAAWYTHNPSLIEYYIDMKLSMSPAAPPKHKVMTAIRECATLLAQSEVQTKEDKMALVQIDKKLFKCQNPDKTDLVGLNKAHKRDAGEDGKLDEGVAKKRKLEREKNEKEAEDLFGPGLVRPEARG